MTIHTGPEIAPLRYRHVAGSLGAAGEWFSTWVMVFGGGTGIAAVGPKIFIWPLVCCFLAAAYVWYYCPETTGRTLEDIDVLFAKPGPHREALERAAAESQGRRGSNVGSRKNSVHSGQQMFSEKATASHVEGRVGNNV